MLSNLLREVVARPAAVRGVPGALPALRSKLRCYGFGAHVSDNDPEVLEKEKQRHLQGKTVSHIKNVPGWSERLASDAEAVVKAERDSPDCSIEEMQRQTCETLKAQEEGEQDAASTIKEPGAMGTA